MASIPVYNLQGEQTGQVELDPLKLDKAVRRGLLKESLIAHLANQRQGTHKTKDRGEVAGGGRKPWRQKGTGRARQGSTRSPQWVGGGRAHAVRPRDYSMKMPAAARSVALRSALRFQLEEGALFAVDGIEAMAKPGTRGVAKCFAKIGVEGKATLVVSEANQRHLVLSCRNLAKVDVSERRNLNAGMVLQHSRVVFTKPALDALIKEVSA
jgi:large subunit ribosomal protein L4